MRIRVGVVGAGWGQLQIEGFRRVKNVEITALCDVDEARVRTIAERYDITEINLDYHDLVSHHNVDLVSVATPPELHKPITQAAIEAGKHVLCEKPLALYARDAGELLGAATRKGIVHAVDFEMRFLPALAYCKELIDEDYLGPLLRVDVTMATERAWGSEHGNWAAEDAQGGGVLMELGAHFIDLLRWWFGDVTEVLASRRTHFPVIKTATAKEALSNAEARSPTLSRVPQIGSNGNTATKRVTGDDAFWSALQFARGGEALLNFVTGARHDPGWTISAYGQTGTLVVRSGQLLGMHEGDREMAILPIPKRLEVPDKPRDPLMWGFAKLAERMAAKISGERNALPFPDFRDGVAATQITDAIRRSSQERRWVAVG